MTEANANTHSAPTRPNYFNLLGLKLDEPWDAAKLQDLIREKRIEWSRWSQVSVGQKALLAQRNLGLISDIEVVMKDAQLRAAELAEARVLRTLEKQRKSEEFEKQLVFINAKDAIDAKELEKFILDFQDIYTKDEISKRVKPAIVVPADKAAGQQLLEETRLKRINELLTFVHKSSLYDFLGLPDVTGTAELGRAAAVLYQREVQRMPKNAEVTARTELAGEAKQLFSAEDTRRQYDESVRQGSINRLLADLEAIMSRVSNKELQAGQVKLFLENAQQAGWARDEAYAHLREHAHTRKWFLAPTEVESQIRCPKPDCRALNSSTKNLCSKCGTALHISCPGCGESVASEDRVCDKCGFEVGNRFRVEQLLQELAQLVSAEKFELAQDILHLLEGLWKPQKPDELLKRINEQKIYIEQCQRKKQAEQTSIAEQLTSLISTRRFYEARSFLQKHQKQAAELADVASYQTKITQSLTKAESLRRSLAQSRHTLNPDDHIARYLDIEDICRDIPGMEDLRIAPNPPSDLRATVEGTGVSLTWQPSTTAHVTYTVVRKERARPNTVQDGLEVSSNLAGCSYDDDATSVSGIPLYYAVYSGYSAVKSDIAAVLAQPVMVTQSVRSLQVKTDDQQIDLNWEAPPNAYAVIVVRKEQSMPASVSDGERVGEYRSAQKQLTDRQIQNGHTYYYAFYCQFKDQSGRFVLSSAEHISATPDVPPQPLQRLDIKSKRVDQEYEVAITWERPARGQVEVRKTLQPFSLPLGTVKSEQELLAYGERLGQHQGQIIERWSKPGVAYYTPLLLYQGMGYVGTSQHFACVETLTDLEILNLGDRLQFSWRWPVDCQEVQIAYSKTDWPGSGVADTVSQRVSLAMYERLGGHWYLVGSTDQEYYVSITAVVIVDKVRISAAEIRRQVRQKNLLEIRYEIKHSGLLHHRPALSLTVNRLEALPNLVLVTRRDRLPLHKNDGDHIRVAAQRPKKLTFTPPVDLAVRDAQPGTYAKLFLEDDALTDRIKIYTPDKEKLRLS